MKRKNMWKRTQLRQKNISSQIYKYPVKGWKIDLVFSSSQRQIKQVDNKERQKPPWSNRICKVSYWWHKFHFFPSLLKRWCWTWQTRRADMCMASSGERWIESTCRHMWVCRFSLVCTTPVKKLRLIYGMLSLVGQFSVLAWHSRCFIKSKEWFDSMIKTQEKIVMHKAMLLPYEMYGISRCLFCQWCTIQSLIWLWMST